MAAWERTAGSLGPPRVYRKVLLRVYFPHMLRLFLFPACVVCHRLPDLCLETELVATVVIAIVVVVAKATPAET